MTKGVRDIKTILVTNDDGVFSDGIHLLSEELSHYGKVIVAAPDVERSGHSHSISTRKPLSIQSYDMKLDNVDAYTISGTPVDCLKVGIETILRNQTIDYVFSGINHGYNVGQDMYYSGTMGAAREASMYGIKAFAMSMGRDLNRQVHTEWTRPHLKQLLPQLMQAEMQNGIFLNINFPAVPSEQVKGIITVPVDVKSQRFEVISDELSESSQVKLRNKIQEDDGIKGSDNYYVSRGYIALSPINMAYDDSLLESFSMFNTNYMEV